MRFFLTLILLISTDAFCWVQTYGRVNDQRVQHMATATDGILVAGNDSNSDAWIMKINFHGEVLWQKTHTVGTVSFINTISVLADDTIIAAGLKAPNDIWILRLDPDGIVLWEKTDNDPGLTSASQISTTSDGGFFATAAHFHSSTQDAWVMKLDSNGNSIWQRRLDAQGLQDLSFGGSQTSDGGFIVSNFKNFKQGQGHSLWLVKLNSSGNKLWERIYGTDALQGSNAHQTADGGYVLSGSIARPNKSLDLWVLKLNAFGIIVWQTGLGGALDETGEVYPVSDGYVVVGYTRSFGFGERDIWVVKLDFSGNVLWQKSYGGSFDDFPNSFVALNNGRYLIGGATESFGQGGYDAWILSIDSNGEINEQCTVSQDTTALPYNPMEASQSFNGSLATVNTPLTDVTLPTSTWNPAVVTQCCSLTLSPTNLPMGEINKPYNVSLSTDSLNATFSVSQGNLPAGLSLDLMTGIISGTPTAAGISLFEITVTDTLGCSESKMYEIEIINCFFCDDFEDGILDAQWTYQKGSWTETNGNLSGQATRKAATLASPVFSGCSFCTIRTSFQMTSGGIKPWLRFIGWHQDQENRVELLIKPNEGKWILRQRHEGRIAARKKISFVVNPVTFYDVAIRFEGNLLRLLINDVEVLTLPPVPQSNPSGTVGFELKAATGTFQSIMVY
ncbi:MAG TPA: putative Ig domain-containing protein [Acidobacteriota bacterium]|nr:putative Ig domain-containing protein [Acidobacteriota bacterium]